jgi:hypothetical protein
MLELSAAPPQIPATPADTHKPIPPALPLDPAVIPSLSAFQRLPNRITTPVQPITVPSPTTIEDSHSRSYHATPNKRPSPIRSILFALATFAALAALTIAACLLG